MPNTPRTPRHARARRRMTSNQRGYDGRWRKARASFLRANPLCVSCDSKGITTAATEVDHIRPHRGNEALFWNTANWQALCKPCHSRKTAAENRDEGRW